MLNVGDELFLRPILGSGGGATVRGERMPCTVVWINRERGMFVVVFSAGRFLWRETFYLGNRARPSRPAH